MRATGIVRRIDDLGRIVIPKEIRRTMRIREGDPMEIFTSREGEILLKKYSPVGELGEFALALAESMSQTLGALVCVTDRDYVIAAAGSGKKEVEGKLLSEELQNMINQRVNQVCKKDDKSFVKLTKDGNLEMEKQAIATILSHGDCIGAVLVLGKEMGTNSDDVMLQVAKSAAGFLGKHMEQ